MSPEGAPQDGEQTNAVPAESEQTEMSSPDSGKGEAPRKKYMHKNPDGTITYTNSPIPPEWDRD